MRLARSLELLRELNAARARWSGWAGGERVSRLEALLAQHDADARARVDPRQTSIFDRMPEEAFR